ncbi:MAG: GrpB family protein [Bdellovibrio sp.]|nr:GrpB family protein [Bdellovibrio sp.]
MSFKNHILLRNRLLENQEARTQYSNLKMRLADEFGGNVDGYCKAKTSFLLKILKDQGLSDTELKEFLEGSS